jgi:hypothetical protein
MVKFAKYNPEPADNENIFQEAWNFVDNTKQVVSEMAVSENDNLKEGGAK